MASSQVALARTRLPAHNPVTRIPAFLNKLYEMVNDVKTNDLIQWSPTGETFFVYDQERFSREVLGHWFKHQNFSSFVRQLNMYGFHKIPHLQQGVLKSEADSEHWNFVHPNFRRDQPDLLCLIQRKKTNAADEDHLESANVGSNSLPTTNNGQVLDIQSIVTGINAIKRHQTTISAELNELKRNNELLWQDSVEARARHQKQQDTINRIVKFLAGVFGHHAGSPVHKEDADGSPPSRAVVPAPRRQSRLMIEGGMADPRDVAPSPVQFATIETPSSMASPSAEPVSPTEAPSFAGSPATNNANLPADDSDNHIISTQPQYPQANTDDFLIAPSRSPTTPEFDSLIQGALSGLTPAQIQQLMNSISMPPMPDLSDPGSDALMSYQPPLDFSQLSSFPVASSPQSSSHLEKLDKAWKGTDDIEQDVDAVDSKINNLFQQFQIPNNVASSLDPSALRSHPTPLSLSSTSQNTDNELFHSFLNGLGDDDQAVDDTAFLDEVPVASDETASSANVRLVEKSTAQKTARKRKSDANTATSDTATNTISRPKRRRER